MARTASTDGALLLSPPVRWWQRRTPVRRVPPRHQRVSRPTACSSASSPSREAKAVKPNSRADGPPLATSRQNSAAAMSQSGSRYLREAHGEGSGALVERLRHRALADCLAHLQNSLLRLRCLFPRPLALARVTIGPQHVPSRALQSPFDGFDDQRAFRRLKSFAITCAQRVATAVTTADQHSTHGCLPAVLAAARVAYVEAMFVECRLRNRALPSAEAIIETDVFSRLRQYRSPVPEPVGSDTKTTWCQREALTS